MEWPYVFGFLGAGLTIASYWMQGIIRLRALAIASNVLNLIYGVFAPSPVTLFQNVATLPLNVVRLREMMRLVDNIKAAASGDLSMDWLKPFMSQRATSAGEAIFEKGDVADSLFVIAGGRFRLVESGIVLGAGEIVGEIGLLTEDNTRTQGVECIEPGELLVASYAQIKELHYQNPEFGFYFLKLVSRRLLQNIEMLHEELAKRPALERNGPC